MSRPRKIAVIGARGQAVQDEQQEVRFFPWNQLHRNQNFKDFDVVVISLLGADGGKRIPPDVFVNVWNDEVAEAVLGHDGRVFVIGDPRFEVAITGPERASVNQEFLAWTKAEFYWLDEVGDTVAPNVNLSPMFSSYLKHAQRWTYCLDRCELSASYWNVKGGHRTGRHEISGNRACRASLEQSVQKGSGSRFLASHGDYEIDLWWRAKGGTPSRPERFISAPSAYRLD